MLPLSQGLSVSGGRAAHVDAERGQRNLALVADATPAADPRALRPLHEAAALRPLDTVQRSCRLHGYRLHKELQGSMISTGHKLVGDCRRTGLDDSPLTMP
jgi:hypothetical protein